MKKFIFDVQRFSNSETITSVGINLSDSVVYGNAGNDYVDITDENVSAVQYSDFSIYGGEGDDTVELIAKDRGSGNAWAALYNATVGVSGESGNDFIHVAASTGSALYDDTFLEINGGTGNDTVTIEGGEGHGVVYDSTLKVNGGDDNDIIGLNGYDVINGGSFVTIEGGAGNDSISITGSHYGIFASDVSINGGEDTDEIFISSIGNSANVSIVAGAKDSISVGSGKATYVFDSTDKVTINGEIFVSKVANDYAELQNADSSVSLKNKWNGQVRIFENNKFTDIEGTVADAEGLYTVVDGIIVTFDTDTTVIDTLTSATDTLSSDTTIPSDPQGGGDLYVTAIGGDVIIIDNASIGGDVNVKNTTTNITNVTVMSYSYNGGNSLILNYQEGDIVQLNSDYAGIDLRGNSFFVNSSSGQLEIQNARDKFIGYSSRNNDVIAYSYVASDSKDVDGRDKKQAEIMIGGDNANNQMYAGSGGSSLWGGNGGNDTLTGGDGYDEFFYAIGSGNDVIKNSNSTDIINLLGVSLEQITSVDVTVSEVNVNFVDGGNLKVEGNTSVGYKLGNTVYAVNQSTGEWFTK